MCHAAMPAVLTNGNVWFVGGGSRDLVPTSPQIPCQKITQGTHGLNTSFGLNLHIAPVFTPKIAWNDPFKAIIFSAPPLFKSLIAYPASAAREMVSHVHSTNEQTLAMINYTSHFAFNPDAVRETLIGIGEGSSKIINSLGHTFSELTTANYQGLSYLITHTISPVFNFVSSLFTWLFAIIFIAIFIYLFYIFRYKFSSVRKKACVRSNKKYVEQDQQGGEMEDSGQFTTSIYKTTSYSAT